MAIRYAGIFTVTMKLLEGLDSAFRPRYATRVSATEGGKRRHIRLELGLDATTCRRIAHDSPEAYDLVAQVALRSATERCPEVPEPLSDELLPWTADGSGRVIVTRARPQ
jgi:hypothetical protein